MYSQPYYSGINEMISIIQILQYLSWFNIIRKQTEITDPCETETGTKVIYYQLWAKFTAGN